MWSINIGMVDLQGRLQGLVEHADGSHVQGAGQGEGQLQEGAALLAGVLAALCQRVCCGHLRKRILGHLHRPRTIVSVASQILATND